MTIIIECSIELSRQISVKVFQEQQANQELNEKLFKPFIMCVLIYYEGAERKATSDELTIRPCSKETFCERFVDLSVLPTLTLLRVYAL